MIAATRRPRATSQTSALHLRNQSALSVGFNFPQRTNQLTCQADRHESSAQNLTGGQLGRAVGEGAFAATEEEISRRPPKEHVSALPA